jgi:hypothetical protein
VDAVDALATSVAGLVEEEVDDSAAEVSVVGGHTLDPSPSDPDGPMRTSAYPPTTPSALLPPLENFSPRRRRMVGHLLPRSPEQS